MAATIRFRGVEATTDGEDWVCEDPEIRRLLYLLAGPEEVQTVAGNPAYDMAYAAHKNMKAEIVRFDKVPPLPKGMIA